MNDCMHGCVHCIHAYIQTYVSLIHSSSDACMHGCVDDCIQAYIQTYVCLIHSCLYAYIHTLHYICIKHSCLYAYIHYITLHTYTYMHAYVCTYQCIMHEACIYVYMDGWVHVNCNHDMVHACMHVCMWANYVQIKV